MSSNLINNKERAKTICDFCPFVGANLIILIETYYIDLLPLRLKKLKLIILLQLQQQVELQEQL